MFVEEPPLPLKSPKVAQALLTLCGHRVNNPLGNSTFAPDRLSLLAVDLRFINQLFDGQP